MRSDRHVDNSSTVVGQDDEDEKQAECDRWDDERSAAMIWLA